MIVDIVRCIFITAVRLRFCSIAECVICVINMEIAPPSYDSPTFYLGQHASVQIWMSLGYLMGALGHHLFPNRATSDGCANVYYYVCWAISYPAMSISNLAWLKINMKKTLFFSPLNAVEGVLLFLHTGVSLIIINGSSLCFFTIPHFDGKEDTCGPKSEAPTCDSLVFYGELAYFAIWFLTFVYVSTLRRGALEVLQTLFLIGGPLQILVVYNILPLTPLWDGTGAELSEMIGTAWSYKVREG